jgi:hypothetical protein
MWLCTCKVEELLPCAAGPAAKEQLQQQVMGAHACTWESNSEVVAGLETGLDACGSLPFVSMAGCEMLLTWTCQGRHLHIVQTNPAIGSVPTTYTCAYLHMQQMLQVKGTGSATHCYQHHDVAAEQVVSNILA